MEIKTSVESMKYYLGEVSELLERGDITDIEVNSESHYVYIDGVSGRSQTAIRANRNALRSFVNHVAASIGATINEQSPTLSAILPEELHRCRLEATISPMSRSLNLVIRKPGKTFPMDDYTDERSRQILLGSLLQKENLLICGSTSSGKTSFLNSLLVELEKRRPKERLIIIEDEHEVQCPHQNHDYLFTIKKENKVIWSMADSVKKSLRMNPDRLIIGEVRDDAAREVLRAWSTGHGGGMCTFHAGNSEDGFLNFYGMAGLDWNNILERRVASSMIDLIIFLSKDEDGRKVREISRVCFDPQSERPLIEPIYHTTTTQNLIAQL
ncbi:MAG: CpaF family protein [Balneolaceae bacterium]|nr:CpaF family protein [Balneolaceae bacterium]